MTREAITPRIQAMVHPGDEVRVSYHAAPDLLYLFIHNGPFYVSCTIEPYLPDDTLRTHYVEPALRRLTERILAQ